MTETNHSTGEFQRTTRFDAPAKRRLAVVALLLLGAGFLVVWIERNTWLQLGRLEQEFAAIRTESFYLGVYLRAGVARLDAILLRFQLSDEPKEREEFHQVARELSERLERAKPRLKTQAEQDLTAQVENTFERYLSEAEPLLQHGLRGIRRDTAQQVYRELVGKSATLLKLCDELVLAQQSAWGVVFGGAQNTLRSLQWLLLLSGLLIAGLILLVVALIYRVLIGPLRMRLSETQATIERQEKLASLGTLAAGVAHEIRNPLTAIKFRLFSLKNTLPASFADTEDMQIIGNEINRLERIVKDVLQFARPSEPELSRVSTTQLLEEIRGLLGTQLRKRSIELQVEAGDPIELRADKQQLKQVLINLVQNAADSIEHAGAVTLRARGGLGRLANGPAPVVILEVADTGQGIPPEVEARLFDPFFSTKEGGTGLGLPIAARIVEKHGGYLQYQTQRNGGTTFSVILPRLTDHVSKDSAH